MGIIRYILFGILIYSFSKLAKRFIKTVLQTYFSLHSSQQEDGSKTLDMVSCAACHSYTNREQAILIKKKGVNTTFCSKDCEQHYNP